MEKLKIENFAGIKQMEFEFKPITVLIGPQGSGKSVVAKLLYFFKSFVNEIETAVFENLSKRDFDAKRKATFTKFFPRESWPKGGFKLVYELDLYFIKIERSGAGQLVLDYSDVYKELLKEGKLISSNEEDQVYKAGQLAGLNFINRLKVRKQFRELAHTNISDQSTFQQLFVPAGRSFFANIQNSIFSFLNDNRSFDPFLVEFGSFYQNFKNYLDSAAGDKNDKFDLEIDKLFDHILSGKYIREKEDDYLIHEDGRRVNLINASSGQQEILPLMIVLKALNITSFSGGGSTLYIEEPEAHLFPTAQKRIIQLLARTFNHEEYKFQIVVTTHSPYVLSSFNNLIEAGKIAEDKPERFDQLSKIVPVKEMIKPELLIGYSILNGKNIRIIDKESKLISQTILDSVSNEIAIEFDKLLDIEF